MDVSRAGDIIGKELTLSAASPSRPVPVGSSGSPHGRVSWEPWMSFCPASLLLPARHCGCGECALPLCQSQHCSCPSCIHVPPQRARGLSCEACFSIALRTGKVTLGLLMPLEEIVPGDCFSHTKACFHFDPGRAGRSCAFISESRRTFGPG